MLDGTPDAGPGAWIGLEAFEQRWFLSAGPAGPEPTAVDVGLSRVVRRKARPRAGGASLVIKNATATEGDAGQVRQLTVKVTRKGAVTGTTQVRFSASKLFATGLRNATQNVDFNAKSGKLSFAPGEKTKTIQIGIIGDNVDEDDEQFQVVLSKPKGAAIQSGTAVCTIVDNDDGKTVDVTISNDDFVSDDNLSYPPTLLPVTLTYTNTGNAASGVTAVQFQMIVFNGGNVDGTVDLGPFILVPSVPAGSSITVDYVLDFNRAFVFNDRWDVYAKVLIEDDNPINNIRRLGDIQITLTS